MESYVLIIDQGTSSCRTLAYNQDCEVLAQSQEEIQIHNPKAAWVEQDAEVIFQTQLKTILNCVEQWAV